MRAACRARRAFVSVREEDAMTRGTMTRGCIALCALLGATALGLSQAQALSLQECSVKYRAAQSAGTLKGMKWSDFRKAECGADATPAPAAATTPSTATN